MCCSVFATLDAALGRDEAVAPIEVLVGHTVGGGAARVLGGLCQIAVPHAVGERRDGPGHQAARRLGPIVAQGHGACILQQLVATGAGGVHVVTGGARHACG